MEFLATLETGLISAVAIIKFCLESISIACVVIGLIKTLQLAWQSNRHRPSLPPFSFNQIRIRFGTWLSLALEFQLGGERHRGYHRHTYYRSLGTTRPHRYYPNFPQLFPQPRIGNGIVHGKRAIATSSPGQSQGFLMPKKGELTIT